jgi:hypothetical protein
MSTGIPTGDSLMLICPNLTCRRTLNVPASSRGKVMRCAYCSAPFRVPLNPAPGGETVTATREDKNE